MVRWTKKADWLPVSNALAQVQFWRLDLQQAETYLRFVKTWKSYNLPGYNRIERIAIKDVNLSKRELKKAQLKLKATYKRVRNRR